jgi:hypothetical protein
MDMHHLKLATTSQAGHGTVELDGQEIQNGLVGVELHVHVGEMNSAILELKAPTFEADGEFQIMLPEETQAALKRLGWTPPPA